MTFGIMEHSVAGSLFELILRPAIGFGADVRAQGAHDQTLATIGGIEACFGSAERLELEGLMVDTRC